MNRLSVPLTIDDTKSYADNLGPWSDSAYQYVRKMTIAGKKITVKKYANPIKKNRKGIRNTKPRTVIARTGNEVRTTQQAYKRRQDSKQRAKNTFENKVHANYPLTPTPYRAPVEITGTYARTMLDRRTIKRDVAKFVRGVQREYGQVTPVRYTIVFERQKERGLKEGNAGTWHFHGVFYNLPYNSRAMIWTLWGQGRMTVQRKKPGYDAAKEAAYLSKYFVKSDEELNKGEKFYISALNMADPILIDRPWSFTNEATRMFYEGYVKTFISQVYDIAPINNQVQIEVWEPPD